MKTRFVKLFLVPAMLLIPALTHAQDIFVSSASGNKIVRISDFPPSTTTFTSSGLNEPEGLAFDGSGNLYVVNFGNNTIEKFAYTGGALSTNGTAFANTGLDHPSAIAVDAGGNVYVANDGNNTVEKFDSNGQGTAFASGLDDPQGLAIDDSGNVYVGNLLNGTIEKFSPAGADLGVFVIDFNNVRGLGFFEGNLYAADSGDNYVAIYGTNDIFRGELNTTLNQPWSVAFDNSGVLGDTNILYVANRGNGSIERYDNDVAFGNRSTGLSSVSYIAVEPALHISLPTATMDWNDMHQRIDGFGGGVVFLDPASLDPVTAANMDTLFDTNNANQLGLTLLRVRIDPTTNWSIALLDGQKAVARGAGVLATPWTPPAGMKDNTNVIGGSLLPSQYTNYANYLNDFAAHMSSNGAPLKAISIQNEPDFVPAGYEGCGWTATQLETFCHNVAELITNAPVLMPESFHFYQTMSDPTLNDPVAAANVSIIGGHLYGAAISDYPNAHDKGKPIWMTEDLVNDQTIASAIATAQEIHDCLTIGNMSAYIWWKCLGDANGLVNASGVPQIRGFVMAQWSRFVRPGYYRIGVTSSVAALISAYRDSASPSFAIVAINTNNVDLTNQIFTLTNFPAANFVIPWITSETLSLASQPSVAVSNSSFTCTLPALSVVTFVSPPIPQLNINRAAPGSVRVLWPATWRFVLQTNDSLASTNWANYGGTINTSNGTNSVTITPPAENLFFRLRHN